MDGRYWILEQKFKDVFALKQFYYRRDTFYASLFSPYRMTKKIDNVPSN